MRWRRRIVGTSLLLLMALAVLALGSLLRYQGLDWADKFGSAASLVIGVIALLYPALSYASGWFTESPPASVTPMAQAQDELAAGLARRWSEEDRWHRIHDPRPLPVRYRFGGNEITGDYNDIAEVFRGLPERRLVILGSAGAGKSVLVVKLARELLTTRQSGDPVPLILSAATWRPEINITDWIEYELERGYPSLASPVTSAEGTTTLARMLADGGVLPIVDALDELPEPLRVRAIADLSGYGSDRPLVLTSRPDEYRKATATFGRPLPLTETATVIPLRVEEARRYLAESTPHHTGWDEVFAALHRDPTGPLTRALTNPLLLWLTRAIYEPHNTDPADLLRHSATEKDLQSHLLGHFAPAVYRDEPGRQTTWRPSQAQRWLRNLAEEVRWQNYGEFTQRIAWWRLASSAGLVSRLVPAAVGTALLWWLAESYRQDPDAFLGTVRSTAERGPLGRVVLPWFEELLPGVEKVFPGTGDLFLLALPNSWLSCVVWFLALHVVLQRVGFDGDAWRAWSVSVLDIRPRTILVRILLVAVVAGLLLPSTLWRFGVPISGGSVGLLVAGVSLWTLAHNATRDLSSITSTTDAMSPEASLRADRTASIVVTAVQAVAMSGLTTLLVGIDLGMAFLVAAVAVVTLRHITGSNRRGRFGSEGYARARLVRWLRQQAPWRLMAFLADAHQRGVLRQNGALYRFRHVRLLEHLAGPEEKDGLLASMLIRHGAPLYQRASRIGVRIMEWTESRLQRDAGSGLEVIRDGLRSTYRDPRIDRWPRARQLSDTDMPRAALRTLRVVVDGTGHVLGLRPSGWRVAVVAAMLPLIGRQRARRYLARYTVPLWFHPDVIRDTDDWDLRIAGLLRSSPSLAVPTTIQPGETMVRAIRQHPYGLARVGARLLLAVAAGVVFTVWAGNGMNLFEFAGLLASACGVAWAIWNLIHHHSARLLITNRRIMIVSGLVTHLAAEHQLTDVSELTSTRTLAGAFWDFGEIVLITDPDAVLTRYQTSPLGRLLGYGTFLFDSGPVTALAFIEWIPQPVGTYRLLVDLADAVRESQPELSPAPAGPSA